MVRHLNNKNKYKKVSNIGAYIFSLLKLHKMTIKFFCEMTEISERSFKRVLNENKAYPSMRNFFKICKMLELVTGTHWMTHAQNILKIIEEEHKSES